MARKTIFQVISERYGYRRSTCITTNRPFKDSPKVLPDALNAQVIAHSGHRDDPDRSIVIAGIGAS